MNNNVLYIPIDEDNIDTVQQGYIDTLLNVGFSVYVYKPKTKLDLITFLDNYSIKFLFTHSKYGIRYLPTNYINLKNICVFIRIFPFNSNDILCPFYDDLDEEIDIISKINNYLCYTHLQRSVWDIYLPMWNKNFPILFVPLAANILRAMPDSFVKFNDVVMISNVLHKTKEINDLVIPLINRLNFLRYSYRIFGDDHWRHFGIEHSGILKMYKNNFSNIYSSSKVCLNINASKLVEDGVYVNDQLFNISLCGGLQVINNSLASDYVENVRIIRSTNNLINFVTDFINQDDYKPSVTDIEHLANHHTYLNRLLDLFVAIKNMDYVDKITENINRIAMLYCWELKNKLGVNNG